MPTQRLLFIGTGYLRKRSDTYPREAENRNRYARGPVHSIRLNRFIDIFECCDPNIKKALIEIIFTKGGDRFANEIPEKVVCDSLGIKIVDGLGLKTHNSSDMIKTK